ncbi:hypothetical protein AAVH_09015 [Aphelenchoides avenae]|nr:hypothetical protein AAVH_09015 [Aphelenchus avenae]
MIARWVAKKKKIAAINNAPATGSFEATEPLEAASFVPLSAAALQARDEKNAAEHFAYKRTVLTERLEALSEEEYEMHYDEEELANSQRYIVRQKQTLLRDLRRISREERAAAMAHAHKSPQAEERDAGEPSLKARFELLFDAKRKILDRLEDVQDKEITRMDEAKKLKARREDIGRRTASAKEHLIRLEHVVMGHDYAQFQCKTTNRTEKSAEADESTAGPMPVIAPLASDEISRERKSAPTPPEGPPPERAKLDEELMLSSLLYPIAHEEEVPFDGRDAEQEPTLETPGNDSTMTSARTRGDYSARRRVYHRVFLTLDELEAQAEQCTFTRNAFDVLRMKCSVCTERIVVSHSQHIEYHLVCHLWQCCLPLRCPEDGCEHMTGRLGSLRHHVHSRHGSRQLTENEVKDCEVPVNKKQMDKIVASVFDRRPPLASSLSVPTLSGDAVYFS